MTTGTDLLNAILDNPDDLDARLIYADWLDEHGYDDRANFIRCQIEGKTVSVPLTMAKDAEGLLRCQAHETVRMAHPGSAIVVNRAGDSLAWERGFIKTIFCPWRVWLLHGPSLACGHPVEQVVISNKRPVAMANVPGSGGSLFVWFLLSEFGKGAMVKPAFQFLPHSSIENWSLENTGHFRRYYATVDKAMAALSHAVIAWARARDHATRNLPTRTRPEYPRNSP